MRKIREVLRLHFECGCQHRQIALACDMSPSTVSGYLSRAECAGLTWEQAKPLSDAEVEVEARLFPGTCLRDERLTEDLWDDLDQLLARACAFDPALRYDDAGALVAALPHVVLGLATGDGRTEQARRPNPLWLTVAERVALSDVIAECPATGARAHLHQLRQRTRLNEYHFAISIRRLEEIGFLETSVAQDQDGDRYTMLKPVAVGVKWAQEHHDDMVAAMAEVAPKASNDGDIPF